jgi:hypothetical protein
MGVDYCLIWGAGSILLRVTRSLTDCGRAFVLCRKTVNCELKFVIDVGYKNFLNAIFTSAFETDHVER